MTGRQLFYDGAQRPLEEVVHLVSADLERFFRRRIQDHEKSGRAWRVLLAGHRLVGSQPDDAAVFSADVCSFELTSDSLVITPMHHHRHALDGLHRAIREAPWCGQVVCEAPPDAGSSGRLRLPLQALRIPRREAQAMAESIRSEADGMRQELRRTVDALCAQVHPQVPAAAAGLGPALQAVDAAEHAKLRWLTASSTQEP